MTHHSWSSIPLADCPGRLRAGDIYTHCFHPFETTIMETSVDKGSAGGVDPAVLAAKRNGVLFDVGFGRGSFSWPVSERCWADGLAPDVISTESAARPPPARDPDRARAP
jgi:dihydroorotase